MKKRLSSFLNPIRHSELIRNSSLLISGNVLGMGVSFLIMPVLSRLYSDADFGVFALMMSLTGILSLVATGKYEEALVLTKDKEEATHLLGFLMRLLSGSALLLFLFFLFFREPTLSWVNMEVLIDYWWLIPLFVFLLGLYTILTNLANKVKHYKAMASAGLLLNLLNALSKVAAYFAMPFAGGLFAGQLSGQLLACFPFYKLRGYLTKALSTRREQRRAAARKYRDFPVYNLPRGVLNSFSMNLPYLLLTGIFGEAKLGLFFMGFNITFRPISLISNSVYQVLYEKVVGMKQQQQRISPIIYTYWKQTLLYITPCFLLAFALAPWLFKIIFGAEWEESGTYFRYILPWMLGVLVATPMGFLPLLFERQRTAMLLEGAYFLSRIAALAVGIYLHDFNLCILSFSLVGLFFMVITLVWYRSLVREYERQLP